MSRIVIAGKLKPGFKINIGQLVEIDREGFEFIPVVASWGPVTKWKWGGTERYNYIKDGAWIAANYGHISIYKERKQLKKIVAEWQQNQL